MGKVGDMGFDVLMVSCTAKCDKNEHSRWRGSDFFRGGLLRCGIVRSGSYGMQLFGVAMEPQESGLLNGCESEDLRFQRGVEWLERLLNIKWILKGANLSLSFFSFDRALL